LLIDVKFDAAHSALWIVLPFHDSVTLAALRTRIGRSELPIIRSVHGLRLWCWPLYVRIVGLANVDMVLHGSTWFYIVKETGNHTCIFVTSLHSKFLHSRL
jgi:hypothetical protein